MMEVARRGRRGRKGRPVRPEPASRCRRDLQGRSGFRVQRARKVRKERLETNLATSRVGRWTSRSTLGPGYNCDNWTATDAGGPLQGLAVRPAGSFTAACSIARPLACCE
jgi:hypothetical protein